MAYTSHGHHIPGTIEVALSERPPTARCGGPGLCSQCSREAVLPSERSNEVIIGDPLVPALVNLGKLKHIQTDDYEARLFNGSPSDCMDVAMWIAEDWDWLKGNALKPFELDRRNGIYIRPDDGAFIIRYCSDGRTFIDIPVDQGNWIIKTDGRFVIYTQEQFNDLYTQEVTD